jgi:hypothetical protein
MIECPELRELFLYMCPQLRENGLIGRTAFTERIKTTYHAVHKENLDTFFTVSCNINQLHLELSY